jgi:UDP-hydrolysing UDP-N-acetyl-D-glucosamine 2-epimerase
MRPVLEAIKKQAKLQLQIIVTGMHLDGARGNSLATIAREGWKVDAVVPWKDREKKVSGDWQRAAATGRAVEGISLALRRLQSDMVIVVGDRVEAFAGATAGHLGGLCVAHVHGGDRALGQMDDALRHAITRLAHVHFPATAASARRLIRMGEHRQRVHAAGSPGVDGIVKQAADGKTIAGAYPSLRRGKYALVVLHPTDGDQAIEFRRAGILIDAVVAAGVDRAVIVYPNNDPGSEGIVRQWASRGGNDRLYIVPDLPRAVFLGLMREAAVMVGNSSSAIIEAASFRTPVVDVGPRQTGRERSGNVTQVEWNAASIARRIREIWNRGRPLRARSKNVYGGDGTGKKIARVLATLQFDDNYRRKLIAY